MEAASTLRRRYVERVWQVWLLTSISAAEEAEDLPERDQSSNHYVKAFEDTAECEQFIRDITNDDRIVLIVDESLSRGIVLRIHELQQLFAFYIYRTTPQNNDTCFKQFSKVKHRRTLPTS